MNKKGALGDQLGIFVLLVLMIIIGGSISYMISVFYGGSYDFREAEANLLSYQIRNCLIENRIDSVLSDKFFLECGLNEEVVKGNSIIRICKNKDNCLNSDESFSIGSDFNQCGLSGAKDNMNFYLCSRSKLIKNGENIEIISGTKQALKRGAG